MKQIAGCGTSSTPDVITCTVWWRCWHGNKTEFMLWILPLYTAVHNALWITKIYYRKTTGQVFTKPVQIGGITQFFSVSCLSSYFTFLPLGDASVCSEKMVVPGEKSFCVLEYHTSKSVVTVQRSFRANYAKDLPTDKTIRLWYKQFTETVCLCKQKAPILTCVWQEL